MSTSRRNFLKLTGVAAASAVGASQAEGSTRTAIQHDAVGMLTDLSVCVGCRKCEFACRKANGLAAESIEAYEDASVFENKRRTESDRLTVVNRYPASGEGETPTYVKTQCMHCNEPACASACLVGAVRKTDEGPVVYDPSICIGCRYCVMACPFNMPAYTYDEPLQPVLRKCAMCFDRVNGSGGVPACAKICPVEAVTFGRRSELLVLARERIERHPDRYVEHIYGEDEVGGTGWMYLAPKPFETLGFNTGLGGTAYPKLTHGFLSLVPLVLTIWPAVLYGAHRLTGRRAEVAASEQSVSVAKTMQQGDRDHG